MNPPDLTQLNGRSVLVKSNADHRDPPIALRGTIDAHPGPQGRPEVKIVLEYPDMNNAAARRGVIPVGEQDAERLLAQGTDGVCEYTINRSLDPGPEPDATQTAS